MENKKQITTEEIMNLNILEQNIELMNQRLEKAKLEYQFFMLTLYRKYNLRDEDKIHKNGSIEIIALPPADEESK